MVLLCRSLMAFQYVQQGIHGFEWWRNPSQLPRPWRYQGNIWSIFYLGWNTFRCGCPGQISSGKLRNGEPFSKTRLSNRLILPVKRWYRHFSESFSIKEMLSHTFFSQLDGLAKPSFVSASLSDCEENSSEYAAQLRTIQETASTVYAGMRRFSCPCSSGVSTLTKLSLSRCWNYCSINFNFYVGYAQVSGDSAPSARRGGFCDRVWPSPRPVRRWATTLCICSYEGGSQVRDISKRFESLSLTVFCHQMAHYRSDRHSPLPGWRRRIWWVPNSKRQCSDWKCLVSLGVKPVPNKLI